MVALSMKTCSKVHCKNSHLFDKFDIFFGESMNLARIKWCVTSILPALNVYNFNKEESLASCINSIENDCK